MSRTTGPKNRLSRREGLDLFGKGNKLRRSTQAPGQHGPKGSRRSTGFGLQLREKQKTKRLYGIIEGQFRGYFNKALKVKGKTGEALLKLLERRLDNVVYRLGFAPTRNMSRQLVSHGHILVNDKKVNIPSYQISVGDTIALSATAVKIPHVKALLESTEHHIPAWLERQALSGRVKSLPERTAVDSPVNEQLIVEFYSR